MKRLPQPYNLLFILAALLLVWHWLLQRSVTLDIHLHDTYIVIESKYIILFPVLYLLLLASLYMIFSNRLLSGKLTFIHLFVTMGVIGYAGFFLLSNAGTHNGPAGMPRRYLDYTNWETFRHYKRLNGLLSVLLLFL